MTYEQDLDHFLPSLFPSDTGLFYHIRAPNATEITRGIGVPAPLKGPPFPVCFSRWGPENGTEKWLTSGNLGLSHPPWLAAMW